MAPLIIGAAMGAAQYYDQQKKAERDRQLQATTARLSPWTGMKPGQVNDPSAVGTIGSGVMTGLQAEQYQDAQDAQENFQQQYLERMPKYQQAPQQTGGPSMMSMQMGPHQDPAMYQQYQQPQPMFSPYPLMVAQR